MPIQAGLRRGIQKQLQTVARPRLPGNPLPAPAILYGKRDGKELRRHLRAKLKRLADTHFFSAEHCFPDGNRIQSPFFLTAPVKPEKFRSRIFRMKTNRRPAVRRNRAFPDFPAVLQARDHRNRIRGPVLKLNNQFTCLTETRSRNRNHLLRLKCGGGQKTFQILSGQINRPFIQQEFRNVFQGISEQVKHFELRRKGKEKSAAVLHRPHNGGLASVSRAKQVTVHSGGKFKTAKRF